MRRLRPTPVLSFALIAVLAGAAWAQSERWSVQVVALRDYREAQVVTFELRAIGLDAYTEFAMLDGLQFVRVRIGCFEGRDAAAVTASAIRGRLTSEAEPVELSSGAQVSVCVEHSVGFLDDYSWRYLGNSEGQTLFAVTVVDKPARLAHDGSGWHVVQDGDELPDGATLDSAVYAQRRHGGVSLVVQRNSGAELVVCPGTLITTSGEWAIVDRGDAVVACRAVPLQGAPTP